MKKGLKCLLVLALIFGSMYAVDLLADRETLKTELVRLHVVAKSDSEQDQSVKLSVRDSVIETVSRILDGVTDGEQAKQAIEEHLEDIRQAANDTLAELGETAVATVTFLEEQFPIREYDSFTLPSGVYDSLRVVIGEGEGKNWWCVVFPKLCYSATSAQLEDAAAGAGFSQKLTNTITGEYQVRFFFLDTLGRIQNFFR